jgi:hypothetical protein
VNTRYTSIVFRLAATTILLAGTLVHGYPIEPGQGGRLSPHESVSGAVDGAQITVTYGRPRTRGRAIFGSLVPFDRVWCPGADEATVLDSTKDLMVGDLMVPSGPHTIWLLPTADQWTLIVSREPSGFHTRYPAERDLGRVRLRHRLLGTDVEQLTFAVEPAAQGAALVMSWEKTEVSTTLRIAN